MNVILNQAFQEYRPTLVSDFIRHAVIQYNRFTNLYGTDLRNKYQGVSIANSNHYRTWQECLGSMVRFVQIPAGVDFPRHQTAGYYELVESKVAAEAEEFADEVINSWAAKIEGKIGELEDSEVLRVNGYTFNIRGHVCGKHIQIEQTIILKCSSKGKLFNQFPARIYVEGKFTSEAAYKKMVASMKMAA